MSGPMDADLKRVGATIRRIRQERQLSQDELARRADIHRTYMGGVERGERNLGVVNLIAVARALGVEPSVLLSDVPVAPESASATPSKVQLSKQ
jgi:transcriptional regulator with XRE-family HTH domain